MKRGRVVLGLVIITASLGWVATKGLTSALVYYQTSTEILHKGSAAVGEPMRLGGYVIPGSIQVQGGVIRFVVTDGTTRMTVIDNGGVPSLFQAGRGVVVEGTYGVDGAFHADTVLVKHDNVYRPPAPVETPASALLAGAG